MWENKLLLFVRFVGILTISLIVTIISTLIFRFISQEEFWEYIICFIVSLIGTVSGLWVLAREDGYKNATRFSVQDFKTYIFVFACQLIFAIIFKFAVYISGSAYWIAHFIWLASGHEISGIGSAPSWLYILCMIVCDTIYFIPVLIGKKQGFFHRLKDREKLMHENSL